MKRSMGTFCAFLALVFLAGCGDDDNPVGVTPIFSIQQFPIKVGDWWQYEVTDTIYSFTDAVTVTRDTVMATVVETIIYDCIGPGCPSSYTRIEFDDGENKWSYGAQIVADTLVIAEFTIIGWGTSAKSWPVINWQFPLEVGKSWQQGAEGTNQTTVLTRGEIDVPAQPFADGYLLQWQWDGFNSISRYDIWAVPEVGIVRQYFGESCTVCSQGDFTSTWELIDWFGKTGISR